MISNPNKASGSGELGEIADYFGHANAQGARAVFEEWPAFDHTPMRSLDRLASALGIGALWLKDERGRLGLGSFKGLGGAFAVFAMAAAAEGVAADDPTALAAFIKDRQNSALRSPINLVVTTATAGNHGRSVAAGAKLMGIDCAIFVYSGVPEDQVEAIAVLGATIIHVDGVYEDAVDRCRIVAEQEGWHVVSDTSWEGYTDIPLRIMQGYAVMVAEAIADLPEAPTHVFVQAGVGGMAAAVAAFLTVYYAPHPPRIIVVEPDRAPCLYESAKAGTLTSIVPGAPTSMGRLECYTPSLLAWRILNAVADGFMEISDEEAAVAVQSLRAENIVTSASGAAGFAGLLMLLHNGGADEFGIGRDSRVLAFITEAAPLQEIAAATKVAAETITDGE